MMMMTENNSSKQLEWESNLECLDYNSSALIAWPDGQRYTKRQPHWEVFFKTVPEGKDKKLEHYPNIISLQGSYCVCVTSLLLSL